ncbi:MAG: radical SAM protein, partial [Candidatus Aenigmatarchaeota archaeon]
RGYQCQGIAYTYTEPTVFLEYALDTMTEAETELYNVFVSNGYMTKETVKKIGPHLDAINVDIKGDVNFYREHCQIKDPEPIYEAMKELKKHDVWIEVTNLIIPGENDSNYHIEKTVDWVRENLGRETPIHFSRFQPHLEMKRTPPTPVDTLERAVDVAYKKGMFYAYAGNVPGHEKESTFCPGCGRVVIKRKGFEITEFKLDRNLKCPHCGREVHIKGRNWIPDNLFKDGR